MWAAHPTTYPPVTRGLLSPSVTSWIRLPKILLIGRFHKWLKKQLSSSGKRGVVTVLCSMGPSLFFLLHIAGCLWWMLGSFRMYSDSEYGYDGEPLNSAFPLLPPKKFRRRPFDQLNASYCASPASRRGHILDQQLRGDGLRRRPDEVQCLRDAVLVVLLLGSGDIGHQRPYKWNDADNYAGGDIECSKCPLSCLHLTCR
jgi:hypothetical protein